MDNQAKIPRLSREVDAHFEVFGFLGGSQCTLRVPRGLRRILETLPLTDRPVAAGSSILWAGPAPAPSGAPRVRGDPDPRPAEPRGLVRRTGPALAAPGWPCMRADRRGPGDSPGSARRHRGLPTGSPTSNVVHQAVRNIHSSDPPGWTLLRRQPRTGLRAEPPYHVVARSLIMLTPGSFVALPGYTAPEKLGSGWQRFFARASSSACPRMTPCSPATRTSWPGFAGPPRRASDYRALPDADQRMLRDLHRVASARRPTAGGRSGKGRIADNRPNRHLLSATLGQRSRGAPSTPTFPARGTCRDQSSTPLSSGPHSVPEYSLH